MAQSLEIFFKSQTATGSECTAQHEVLTDNGGGINATSGLNGGYIVWYDENAVGPITVTGIGDLIANNVSIWLDSLLTTQPASGFFADEPFDGTQLSDVSYYEWQGGWSNSGVCVATIQSVGFQFLSSNVNEANNAVNHEVRVIATNVSSGSNIKFAVTVDPASTAEVADYVLNTTSITITDSGQFPITLTINPDAGNNDETIILNLVETTTTGITVSPDQHTIYVTDDEGQISPNGNGVVKVFFKTIQNVLNNSNNRCAGLHDVLTDISGTLTADAGTEADQYLLYYDPNVNGTSLTLSEISQYGIQLFIDDATGGNFQIVASEGYISTMPFDGTQNGTFENYEFRQGNVINPAFCTSDGTGNTVIRRIPIYYTPTDINNPNGEYCQEKRGGYIYYENNVALNTIEEILWEKTYYNTSMPVYYSNCDGPEPNTIVDINNSPFLLPFDIGYYGDDIFQFYLYDDLGVWNQSDAPGHFGTYTQVPDLDPNSPGNWTPWECNYETGTYQIDLYYGSDPNNYCASPVNSMYYYWAGGVTLTFAQIINLQLPIFTDLQSATEFWYCRKDVNNSAIDGLYGSETVNFNYYVTANILSPWIGSGNCISGGNPSVRSIEIEVAKCDDTTGNNLVSVCHYPTETVTVYYSASIDLQLLEIVQYNKYLYTDSNYVNDYNYLITAGHSIKAASGDNSMSPSEYVIFTGSFYIGRNGIGGVETTQSVPNLNLTNGITCPTVTRPPITESETLSDGGNYTFYAFYACNPSVLNQNPLNLFGAFEIYLIDGLHFVGDSSAISDLIDHMRNNGRPRFSSNNQCECYEYIHTIESQDIGTAKLLLDNYYANVRDVTPGEIGIISNENVALYETCDDCSNQTNASFYQVGSFDAPEPITPGPNLNTEKNYKLDNVSKPLLRTNPKLSSNVKLVVDSSDRIYLESINATQDLSNSKYKKYELNEESKYSYDLSRFYNDNNTPLDSTFETKRNYSDFSVLDEYRKQLEEDYHYGTKLNISKLYTEDYRLTAPIWLDINVPKKFVIYRVSDPTPDTELGDGAGDKLERILKLVKNSKIIKVFDLSKQSRIGKYLRNHVQDEFFPASPLTITMEEGEKSSYNGIDLIKGGFVQKGEYIYNDFVKNDLPLIDANNFITDGFKRNKVACANLINLEFMFDDNEASDYSVNRYFGLYVDDVPSGAGEVSYIKDGIIKFKTIESYMDGSNPTFAIPEYRLLRETGLLTYAKIKDDFFTLDPAKSYSADRYNMSINATDSEIEARLGIFSTGTIVDIVENKISDSDFIKFEVVDTPENNDTFKVSMIKKESVRFKIIKNKIGDTVTISDFLGNYVEFQTGTDSNDTWNNLSARWTDLETYSNGGTVVPTPNTQELKFYRRYKLNLEITNQINSVVFTERSSNLIDNELSVSTSGITTIATNEIYTNVDPSIGTFFADSSGSLDKKRFTSNTFSALGSFADIAFSIAGAIRNNSDFEAYSVGNFVYVKSKTNGYRLMNATLLVSKLNLVDFISPENRDESNELGLNDSILSIYDVYYLSGGNTGGKSVFVPSNSVSLIVPGYYLPTRNSGKYNLILDVVDDTINRNGEYFKVILKDTSNLTAGGYEIFAANSVELGLFSAYDIHDMDFDFYSTSNSDLKELKYETSENMNYAPYEYANGISPNTTLRADATIDPEFAIDPVDYFANLLPYLKNEDSTAIKSEKIYTEYDRLKENYTKEYSTNSRVVPNINKWVLKDSMTVRDEPYFLNVNEAFGRTNFSPDITSEGRDASAFSHEWFYIDKWPTYLTKEQYNEGFSYINFMQGFEVDKTLFESSEYDYFDRLMITEGHEINVDLGSGAEAIYWTKTQKRKKYTIIDGGSDLDFGSTIFKGLKFYFKTKKESSSSISTEFVKNSDFNGYRFSIIAKVTTDSNSNSVSYEFIKNDVFGFVVLFIEININDSFVDYLNRKYLYELKHKIVADTDISGSLIYKYDDVIIDGAVNFSGVVFSGAGPYIAEGIQHVSGSTPKFEQQIAPGVDETYGRIKIEYNQGYTPNAEPIYLDILSTIGNDRIQISGAPYYINSVTSQKVILNANAIPYNVQASATYTYIGGGVNAYSILFDNLSANYFYNLQKTDPSQITFTSIDLGGVKTTGKYGIGMDDGNEIIKNSNLVAVADTNTPKTFKLKKETIGYNIDSTNTYSPFLIRHNGRYTVNLKPVVTFTDVYNFNKVIRNHKEYDVAVRELKEPYYKLSLLSNYATQKAASYYNKFSRLGVAFNVGFIDDGGTHDSDWGIIKNHFYHKVNEINTSGVTKLTESSENLPQYPLINEIAIDKRDINVFKSSWESNYYIRSSAGGEIEYVPGTISTIEEKSYLGSSAIAYKPSYSIYQFTSTKAGSASELDEILKNSNNKTNVVYFEDESTIQIDFYMNELISDIISNEGLKETMSKFVTPENSAGDKTTINDDVEMYVLDNMVQLYLIDEIRLYVKKYKGLESEVITTSSVDLLDNGGYVLDNNYTYRLHGQKSLNFRLIYNKTLGYSYSIRSLIKIQA